MSDKIFFTPGPSQLYPGIEDFVAEAFDKDLGSVSHRSQAFQDVYQHTVRQLRNLLNLPDNFHVFFLGSASESWERIILNLTQPKDETYHFVNGSFSKKFFSYSKGLGRRAQKYEAPFGEGFDVDKNKISDATELISFTQNETSSGVSVPLEDIYKIREKFPEKILAVDVVSSLPFPDFDFSKIDTFFFSVQKCFGLPAGLGVWVVNDRCISKAQDLDEKGNQSGPHHNISSLLDQEKNNSVKFVK